MDGVFGLTAFCLFALVLGLLADWQRQHFGHNAGNVLFIVELTVSFLTIVASWLYRRERRALALSFGALSAACLFMYLAWFVHPNQVIERASDRLGDYELARDNYYLRQQYGETDPRAAIRTRHIAVELAARRLEYTAALMRYREDPKEFRSTLPTWSFGILGIGSAAAAFVAFRQHRRGLRVAGIP